MHLFVFYQRYDKMLLRFAGIPVFCHAACCCCSACCARHAIWLPDGEGRGLTPPGAGPRGSRGPHPCPGQPSSHPSTNGIPSLLAGPFPGWGAPALAVPGQGRQPWCRLLQGPDPAPAPGHPETETEGVRPPAPAEPAASPEWCVMGWLYFAMLCFVMWCSVFPYFWIFVRHSFANLKESFV